jgi:hypothetical protein
MCSRERAHETGIMRALFRHSPSRHPRDPSCPSDLQLEAHLLAQIDLRPHIDICPRCRARVELMIDQGNEFERLVYPATRRAVVAAGERPDRSTPSVFLRAARLIVSGKA